MYNKKVQSVSIACIACSEDVFVGHLFVGLRDVVFPEFVGIELALVAFHVGVVRLGAVGADSGNGESSSSSSSVLTL